MDRFGFSMKLVLEFELGFTVGVRVRIKFRF